VCYPYLIQEAFRCEASSLWSKREISAVAQQSHSVWTWRLDERIEALGPPPLPVHCSSGLLIASARAAADATVSAAVHIPMKVAVFDVRIDARRRGCHRGGQRRPLV
jgi:hypothetical protein